MRLLCFLSWCFLVSVVRSEHSEDCEWKMPKDKDEYCIQKIRWKCHNNKQATATCLEYFPTTFVEGEIDTTDPAQIKCKVLRQFQCNFAKDSFSMFDKCYTFKTDEEKTMTDYLKDRATLCPNGGNLPVFFSMSQGKHIAKQAHRLGINKMWVNVDMDGKTIDKSSVSKKPNGGDLLYKEQWKLHDDMYWQKDELMMTPKGADGKKTIPATSKYLFFRTRTDHLNNLIQGSFERASEDTTASVVCEYEAKTVLDQKLYCAKLQALGLNAEYYEDGNKKRCVYTTLTKYPLMGTKEAVTAFTGCNEKPSDDHSSGLDDGTASNDLYTRLTKGGTYRVASAKMDTKLDGFNAQYLKDILTKCDSKYYDSNAKARQRQPYQIFDHFGRSDFSGKMKSDWEDGYPKSECSDFPTGAMDSNTLAIRNGKIIDVPVPVRFPVLCSIATNVDCAKRPKLCVEKLQRSDYVCEDDVIWNEKTGYAKCVCPVLHVDKDGMCDFGNWNGGTMIPNEHSCGVVHNIAIPEPTWLEIVEGYTHLDSKHDDKIDKALVRRNCHMTVWSHPKGADGGQNYKLLDNAGYGEHVVPNHIAKTANGWDWGMSASSLDCTCD